MSRRGFSVLELVIALSLLMLISGVMFVLFNTCSNSFQLGMVRQSLQGQLRRISTRLARDIRQTSFHTLSVNSDTVNVNLEPGTITVARDSICLAHTSSYDAVTGQPVWNGYTVYTATKQVPRGQLISYDVSSSVPMCAPGVLQQELDDFNNSVLSYKMLPSVKAQLGTSKTWTQDVHQFAVTKNDADQVILVRLGLRGEQGHTQNGRRSLAEAAEVVFRFKAENTWPRL
ncbi:hypothetical protein JST97_05740 [bacterium]|nr:hypothetical protein [bacterium]